MWYEFGSLVVAGCAIGSVALLWLLTDIARAWRAPMGE
jgi:hypothetical protein